MSTELISRIQDLVREHYVFADVAERIATAVAGCDLAADPAAAAAALTTALQSVNGDRHLRVRHFPDGVPPEQDEAEVRAYWTTHVRQQGGGIVEARRLDDNVGLLVLGPVIPPAEMAAVHVQAAFTLLTGTRRLVLDLRGCLGGVPETVALICSYCCAGSEPVHLQDMVGRDGSVRQSWTITSVTPKVDGDVPLYVLVGPATFSGGEELAYDLQALGRATLVGEATGGGAHPREAFDLTATLQLHIPVARPVNPVTGTNWEATGVQPDVPCPADKALEVALAA
jgi:hypothetical protein